MGCTGTSDVPAEGMPATPESGQNDPVSDRASGLTWRQDDALRGLVFALPAAVATVVDPARGLPLALGVLPAAMVAMPGHRRHRIRLFVVGAVCGIALFLGGALSELPVPLTAVALILMVVGAAAGASRAPAGQILLVLAAPLTAAGLSFADWDSAVDILVLMLAGSAYAWLVSLAWPESAPAASAPPGRPPDRGAMLNYGLRLGIAAAIAYLITSAMGLDHPGWAPAACLLVARPNLDLLQIRGIGRVVAVTVGAILGALAANAQLPAWLLAITVLACLAGAAGLRTSRWYVTSLFTTYLVVLMLLGEHPDQTAQKVNERIGETLLGVALAYLFGWLIPTMTARRSSRAATAPVP